MGDRFDVSVSEDELARWIRARMRDHELNPSFVFRDAMIAKKQDWENNKNLEINKKIVFFQKMINNYNKFIEEKGLEEEWTEFFKKCETL